MSSATTSPFLPASTAASPPSTKPAATSAPVKHLSIHPKLPDPFAFLSLRLSSACRSLHDSVVKSTFSGRPPRRLHNSNPNKPPFPFQAIANAFNGFTHHLSNLLIKNPIFNKPHAGKRNPSLSSHFFCPPAMATEAMNPHSWDSHGLPANSLVELERLSRIKRYKISDIKFVNPRTRAVVSGADESFGDLLGLKRGGVYTKQQLIESLDQMSSSQLFEKVEFDVKTNPDGSVDINIPHREKLYPPKTKFRCVAHGSIPEEKPIDMEDNMTQKEMFEYHNRMIRQQRKRIESGRACMLGDDVEEEIESMMVKRTSISASLLRKIIRKIHKWYHDNEYYGASVIGANNLENPGGDITFEVVEGDINKIQVNFVDKLGNLCEGNTNLQLIHRVLTKKFAVGRVFNRKAIVEAFRNLEGLGLFSDISVNPVQDDKNGAFSVDITLQELPQKWSEVTTESNIVPSRNRLPTLASLRPSSKISFGYKNIKGLNRSLQGELNLSNLFDHRDGIGFNFEYKHPYVDGIDDPRNRTFRTSFFNTSKLSPVFRGGPGVDGTPPIWVDRFGVKANITEDYTGQSKFTYGLVLENIRTRGEEGFVVSRGDRVSVDRRHMNGPPTTLSGSGIDRMAFLQANLTRDNTRFVNEVIVGARDVFQVDQGLGIGGFFNRHKLSATRFIPLKQVQDGKGEPGPPVLVLHGLYGGCVGDLPNHEAFIIGGPYSVRGYDMGEIGASRNKLEVGAEVRVAVMRGTYVYAFAEHGNDLGSSVKVRGNPTKSYMRRGHGSSYGGGIKVGHVRAEYAFDNNTRTGAFFFHVGDRY